METPFQPAPTPNVGGEGPVNGDKYFMQMACRSQLMMDVGGLARRNSIRKDAPPGVQ
jgi:hypothetical protein